MSGSSVVRKFIACYDSRVLCCEEIYCLIWFKNPLLWESILPLARSFDFRMAPHFVWWRCAIIQARSTCLFTTQNTSAFFDCTYLNPDFSLLRVSQSAFLHLKVLPSKCEFRPNDYHSKTCIDIMCKNLVLNSPKQNPRPDILRKSWQHSWVIFWCFPIPEPGP